MRATWLFAVALMGCATIKPVGYAAANAALPVLVETYKQEELACVSDAKTRTEAQDCMIRVRMAWSPVWRAWENYRAADGALREYCQLVLLLPATAPFSRVACQ